MLDDNYPYFITSMRDYIYIKLYDLHGKTVLDRIIQRIREIARYEFLRNSNIPDVTQIRNRNIVNIINKL